MSEHWTSSSGSRRRRPERRLRDEPELLELRQETIELRRLTRSASPRPLPRSSRARRRWRLVVPAAIVLVALILVIDGTSSTTRSYGLPRASSLAGMDVGQRIVAIAKSQLGYSTDPSNSYCNKFSAYWGAGTSSCPTGESAEKWCADFAAWAWQKAGVPFRYGFGSGEINAAAASFYTWGVYHGTWHSVSSGYWARPGDVAVYGLDLGTADTAAHVAVVTADPPGRHGPDVVNGDGDRTGFSVVETGTEQLRADTVSRLGAPLAGYVSPD